MANHSETLSDNFDDNDSSKVNTPSAFLSAIDTKADVGSISTTGSRTIFLNPQTLLYDNERRKDSN